MVALAEGGASEDNAASGAGWGAGEAARGEAGAIDAGVADATFAGDAVMAGEAGAFADACICAGRFVSTAALDLSACASLSRPGVSAGGETEAATVGVADALGAGATGAEVGASRDEAADTTNTGFSTDDRAARTSGSACGQKR